MSKKSNRKLVCFRRKLKIKTEIRKRKLKFLIKVSESLVLVLFYEIFLEDLYSIAGRIYG